jgi:hypothetical protein
VADKIIKFCNNCTKPKLVTATHNYANCCGGRPPFRHDEERLAAYNAEKARIRGLFAKYSAEWGIDL